MALLKIQLKVMQFPSSFLRNLKETETNLKHTISSRFHTQKLPLP